MPTKCERGTPKMTNWEANCIINCRRAMRRLLLTSVIALFLSAAQAYSVDELLPPFGFRWNDSMAHVDAVLHGAKAKITSREKKENRDVWTVEGLVHPGLKRTLFTFKQRALVAVELQYDTSTRSTGPENSCHVPATLTPTSSRRWLAINGWSARRCLSFFTSLLNTARCFTARLRLTIRQCRRPRRHEARISASLLLAFF